MSPPKALQTWWLKPGFSPSITSSQKQAPYSHPSNRFWKQVFRTSPRGNENADTSLPEPSMAAVSPPHPSLTPMLMTRISSP